MRLLTLSRASAALLPALALLLMAPIAAAENDEDKEPGLPLEGKTEKLNFTTGEGSWLAVDVVPDGELLVFDLLGDPYALPVSGGEAIRLTSGLGFDSQPAIAPYGEWIAFVSDRSGADNLWIARPDGSDAREFSDGKQFGIIYPAWSEIDARYSTKPVTH